MNTYSKKRARENRIYLALRKVYLEENPICINCWAARSVDVDHITNRSQSSKAFLDQDNWQALCRPCHDAKGTGPGTALSVPGWQYRQANP